MQEPIVEGELESCAQGFTNIYRDVSPLVKSTAVRPDIFLEEAFEINAWMKSLERQCFEVAFHVRGSDRSGDSVTVARLTTYICSSTTTSCLDIALAHLYSSTAHRPAQAIIRIHDTAELDRQPRVFL
jgi:hypothetical protein